MKEFAFACQLTSPELQKRKASIISELRGLILSREELDSGYKYTFPNSENALDLIFDFVKTEKQCCPFFDFNISIGTACSLSLTGENGIKNFISTELDL